MPRSSNIRVSVKFKQAAVFAGEDVDCIITFTNRSDEAPSLGQNERPRLPPRRTADALPRAPAGRRLQTSMKFNGARNRTGLTPISPTSPVRAETSGLLRKPIHKRSISIISIKSEGDALEAQRDDGRDGTTMKRGQGNHRRGSSAQVDVKDRVRSRRSDRSPETDLLVEIPRVHALASVNGTNSSIGRTVDAAYQQPGDSLGTGKQPSLTFPLRSDFKFPRSPLSDDSINHPPDRHKVVHAASPGLGSSRDRSPIPEATTDTLANPISRLLAATSMNGTPRSSIDLQSDGNRSDETLASEYPTQTFSRMPPRGASQRQASKLADVIEHAEPETFMMGYAQITGSFVLDGSLVNQSPFEDVKRRSVVGGYGAGGVVGVERKKRDSGLFGNLGWSAIGDSLGNLLGSGEVSSIKEMRNVASSRAVPVLSTPQSILFVDLKLAPGDSKQYSYSLTLPRGLPPSHKGRAIKTTYTLQIGLQRPGSRTGVSIVEVPFRVFSTVNLRGETLFHDLMSPHISLKDLARVSVFTRELPKEDTALPELSSFLAYAETLLDTDVAVFGLLSPTIPQTPQIRRNSSLVTVANSKEAVDLAVMKSHQPQQSNLSTRYSIARSSRPVATLMLPRSAYRLGETIHFIVDFGATQGPSPNMLDDNGAVSARTQNVPVYAVLVTLETHETIDETIAMRSPQSIYRYTRKIHAQAGEKALFSRRLCFALAIPPGATPEFGTTGIGLEWRIRVEFMTPIFKAQASHTQHEATHGDDDDDDAARTKLVPEEVDEQEWPELLEDVISDDRGQVLQGIEQLYVDTFEVAVPIRVYGAVMGAGSDNDSADMAI